VDNPVCGGSFAGGGVVRIDPHSTGKIDELFPVKFCQPAGLTVGPNDDLLVGCSQAFDTAGNAWTATDPHTAAPISVIMDAKTGAIDRMVAGVSGNDEVWFNRGDGRYYLAARNQPGGPVVGVIDAESQRLVQVVPTLNVGGKNCTLNALNCSAAFPAGTAHSLAVDPHNNHVLVPLAANNVFPFCLNGCIGVFGTPNGNDDDSGRDPLIVEASETAASCRRFALGRASSRALGVELLPGGMPVTASPRRPGPGHR
jgi:hypothetical protein